jgi:hypothetical protein
MALQLQPQVSSLVENAGRNAEIGLSAPQAKN